MAENNGFVRELFCWGQSWASKKVVSVAHVIEGDLTESLYQGRAEKLVHGAAEVPQDPPINEEAGLLVVLEKGQER